MVKGPGASDARIQKAHTHIYARVRGATMTPFVPRAAQGAKKSGLERWLS